MFKVACTSGLKCLYSLVNYISRNFEHIFIKPQINPFPKINSNLEVPISFFKLNVVVVDCGLTSHSAIFQLYSDETDVQFPNFDLLPGTHAMGS